MTERMTKKHLEYLANTVCQTAGGGEVVHELRAERKRYEGLYVAVRMAGLDEAELEVMALRSIASPPGRRGR